VTRRSASAALANGGEFASAAPEVGGIRWLEPEPHEQTRARYPDAEGFVERAGVRIFWERYGEGEPTVLLLPTWSIVHSRFWKNQIPYLARHMRVVTFDGRGNGRSDRPEGADAYTPEEFAADAVAILDATGTRHAALVALSCGALWATRLAAAHPGRVDRIAYISPAVGLAPGHAERAEHGFQERYDDEEGWAKYNRHYWLRDDPGFLEFFFAECFSEPHSTKPIEDAVRWGSTRHPRCSSIPRWVSDWTPTAACAPTAPRSSARPSSFTVTEIASAPMPRARRWPRPPVAGWSP
jgi:pimeloyl-ACP methyl ester carboxylesterase